MTMLEDLFGVDHSRTFNFFLSGLQKIVRGEPCNQMLYVANVLAHHAQTPRYNSEQVVFKDLGEMLSQAVFVEISDPEILQIYGSHIILLAGFFRDQVRHRHNVEWYDQLGQRFYYQVGQRAGSDKERDFFGGFADALPRWTSRCCYLSRYLREERLLLKMDRQ